jgi:hypothetical protein
LDESWALSCGSMSERSSRSSKRASAMVFGGWFDGPGLRVLAAAGGVIVSLRVMLRESQ